MFDRIPGCEVVGDLPSKRLTYSCIFISMIGNWSLNFPNSRFFSEVSECKTLKLGWKLEDFFKTQLSDNIEPQAHGRLTHYGRSFCVPRPLMERRPLVGFTAQPMTGEHRLGTQTFTLPLNVAKGDIIYKRYWRVRQVT